MSGGGTSVVSPKSSMNDFGVNANYYELCRNTIKCYEELQAKMESPKIKEHLNSEVLVIFGPTRSGKSTFLLRLASEMGCESFMTTIHKTKQNEGVIFKYEDIEVASGHLAVTMVPNFYILGDRLIVDLAGFNDLTPTRRPIISLLNYFLLSQIPSVKILTVYSMESVLGHALNTSIRTYYDHYKDLLTENNIEKGLSSTVFLVTKGDVYGQALMSETGANDPDRAFFNSVGNYALDLGTRDRQLSQIAATVAKNKVIINYEQPKEQLLNELNNRLARTEVMNASLIKLDLESIQNEIVTQCTQVTKSYYNMIGNLNKDMNALTDKLSSLNTNLTKTNGDVKALHDLISEKSRIQETISQLNVIHERSATQIENATIKLSDLRKDHEDTVTQRSGFQQQYQGFSMLSTTIGYSSLRGADHKIYFEYESKTGNNTPTSVIVLNWNDYEVNRQGILKAKSKDDIMNMKLKDLALDQAERKNIVISPDKNHTVVTVNTSLKRKHVILFLDTINVRDTPLIPLFMSHFTEREKLLQSNIDSVHQKVIEFKKTDDKTLADIRAAQHKISIAENSFAEKKTAILRDISALITTLDSHRDGINGVRGRIDELFNNPILEITSKIGEILIKARIGAAFLENLKNNQREHTKLKQTNEGLFDKVNKLVHAGDLLQHDVDGLTMDM